ncbi:MAG: DUF2892 domain-containing protein [candidate division WOR-3 bacterium]|uniref:DUF2892 domain-containing protein n=1 Tax=candidate division WOR-3 bacterium TaxID=2052148 RepID=A0A7V3ZT20_UNCW3
MKRNVGNIDSWIRLIIGAILFGLGAFSIRGGFKWILIIIGGILVLTSLFNYCPIYTIFKISTYKKQE